MKHSKLLLPLLILSLVSVAAADLAGPPVAMFVVFGIPLALIMLVVSYGLNLAFNFTVSYLMIQREHGERQGFTPGLVKNLFILTAVGLASDLVFSGLAVYLFGSEVLQLAFTGLTVLTAMAAASYRLVFDELENGLRASLVLGLISNPVWFVISGMVHPALVAALTLVLALNSLSLGVVSLTGYLGEERKSNALALVTLITPLPLLVGGQLFIVAMTAL